MAVSWESLMVGRFSARRRRRLRGHEPPALAVLPFSSDKTRMNGRNPVNCDAALRDARPPTGESGKGTVG
jgi:hypothetical protein